MKLFCFGMGYVASHFAKLPIWQSVYGTHRDDFPLNEEAKFALKNATHILISIPPDAQGDIALKEISNLQSPISNLQWLGYLSTTGVYGDMAGGWANENTPLNPNNERSKWRVLAENQWQASGLPVNIYRLSGIYGAGRSAIDELKNGTAKRIYKENQFFSRIHVDDIAQVLAKSLNISGEIYNLADDKPAPSYEVVEYAAKLMGITPPPLVKFEDAELSEMARSFYSSSRRMENTKIKQLLGGNLKYPTYKEGLGAVFTLYKQI